MCYNKLSVCLSLLFFAVEPCVAQGDASKAEEIIAHGANVQLLQKRIGEGNYEISLVSGGRPETVIWKSFWGSCEAKVSPNGKYVAICDKQRWLSSVVVVVRISDLKIIYETPGSFDKEEKNISFGISDIDDRSVEIIVFGNEFPANSSRPKQKEVLKYFVIFSSAKPIKAQTSLNDLELDEGSSKFSSSKMTVF